MKRMISTDSLLIKNKDNNVLDQKLIKLNSTDKIPLVRNKNSISYDSKINHINSNTNILLTHNNYYSSKYRTYTENEQRNKNEDFIFGNYSQTLEGNRNVSVETKNYKARKYSKRLYGSLNLFNENENNINNKNSIETSRNHSFRDKIFNNSNDYDIVFHRPKDYKLKRSNTSLSNTLVCSNTNNFVNNSSRNLPIKNIISKGIMKQNFNINGIYVDPLVLKSSKK